MHALRIRCQTRLNVELVAAIDAGLRRLRGGTMWIANVLTSEFFWGVIVGLVLSVIGAYCLAIFTAREQQKGQKNLIKNFCIDTVNNVKANRR